MLPSGISASTPVITCESSPPYAPAFINTPPPMLPGMPEANSSPESDSRAAARAVSPSIAPAPAFTVQASASTSMLFIPSPIIITTPLNPLSLTSTLEPLPSTTYCAPSPRTISITARSSSTDAGSTSTSAGPPTLNVVYPLSASSRFTTEAALLNFSYIKSMFKTPTSVKNIFTYHNIIFVFAQYVNA